MRPVPSSYSGNIPEMGKLRKKKGGPRHSIPSALAGAHCGRCRQGICYGVDLPLFSGPAAMLDNPRPDDSAAFPTTAWGLLRAGQEGAGGARIDHRNQFLARYWKPVFVFLRARRYSPQQAEELTQEFFLRLLEGDELRRVQEERGRFRNYLLTLLVRFVLDQTPDRLRRQTAFEEQALSLDCPMTEEERSYEPPGGQDAETLFMRQWAIDLVAGVRCRLKDLCEKKGRAAWYGLFDAAHPAVPDAEAAAQEDLARRFGTTRDRVRYGLKQTEDWFRVLLRAEVRDQVGSAAEVDDEVGELLRLLSPWPARSHTPDRNIRPS
jgi:hypothetical protein